MDTDLPPLIRALLQPHRYAGNVAQVQLVQTHISWVLLAGEFAYKIKKPLRLPFLDFSTLALRKQRCEDELRLNRRFASDLYLEVVGIFNTLQDPQWEGTGQPIEYAVKMRSFDDNQRLDRVCQRGELQAQHLSQLADNVVAFHGTAERARPDSPWGTAAAVIAPVRDSLRSLLQWSAPAHIQAQLLALQTWAETQCAQLAPLMEARKQAGWVRECHGDLHLANMVLLGQQVRMFDCIEFSENLRWIDVASEIAFTYIDLMAHGQSGLANWFVNEVWERTGDYEAARVLPFYAVYRALVRAQVATIRAQQTQQTRATAEADSKEACAYIALAHQLATPLALRLLITHGLSGCGKTVASSQLLQTDTQARTLRLRSDVERKRLFGLAATAHSTAVPDDGIYTPSATARTYTHLHTQADTLLRAGWSVIVDATFLKRADRDTFRQLAQETGATFGIVAPEATYEQLRQRIAARNALGQDASDATLEVLAQQVQALEPLASDEPRV